MKLRTKRIEQWIVIDGANPDEKAEFLVHPQTPKESSKLLEKAKKNEWDKGQRFTDHDFYKFKMDRICATIIDWKGLEDEDGKPIPCTDKNKEIVYLGNPDLIDQVLEKADDLYKESVEAGEKETKNSLTAQPGMGTRT